MDNTTGSTKFKSLHTEKGEWTTPSKEVARFIIKQLNDPKTKKNPAMVAAIAELYKALPNGTPFLD